MTARVRATNASRHAGWPTTLRFSRRLGESVRDAEYAAWLEGPGWSTAPRLKPRHGVVSGLAAILAFLRRSFAGGT